MKSSIYTSSEIISILIATKNRPEQIKKCLNSIFSNTFRAYKIILLDQSTNADTELYIQQLKKRNVIYIPVKKKGKSYALNIGLYYAKGDIIAYTDDDCVVHKTWLMSIYNTFIKNPQISCLFGKTMPYLPKKNKGMLCPSIMTRSNKKIISKPCRHWKYIGFGNNMAIRKTVFHAMDGFKHWLGPHSIGMAAEDAELALRCLIKKHKLLYTPDMIVYHDKWLGPLEIKKQALSYTCGELTCYAYFYFQGYKFAQPVVLDNIKDSLHTMHQISKKIICGKWEKRSVIDITYTFLEIFYRTKGLIMGRIFSLTDPIRQ